MLGKFTCWASSGPGELVEYYYGLFDYFDMYGQKLLKETYGEGVEVVPVEQF